MPKQKKADPEPVMRTVSKPKDKSFSLNFLREGRALNAAGSKSLR